MNEKQHLKLTFFKSELHLVLLVSIILISTLLIHSYLSVFTLLIILTTCTIYLNFKITSQHQKKKFILVLLLSTLFIITKSNVTDWNNDSKIISFKNNKEYKFSIIYNNKTSLGKIIKTNPYNENLYGINVHLSKKIKFINNEIIHLIACVDHINKTGDILYLRNKRIIKKYSTKNKFLNKFEKYPIFYQCSSSIAFGWAMLTGSKKFIKYEDVKRFINTGTMHLFAVSGLHVGFFYMILSILFKWIYINHKTKLLMKIIVCGTYIFLIGYPYSAIRALLMISMYEFCKNIYFKNKNIVFFSITLILFLFLDTKVLYSISVQLSFTVVLFILFSLENLNQKNDYSPLDLSFILVVSISASSGSALLLLDYFGHFSFVGILVNVLISPIIFIFYFINILFFCLYFTLDSYLIISFQVLIYDIISYIIQFGVELSKLLPKQEARVLNINNIIHFCVFILILFTFCFQIPSKIRIFSVSVYYLFLWITCLCLCL